MPLTPAEEAELKALEAELGAAGQGGLTPAEEAELAQLERELEQAKWTPEEATQESPEDYAARNPREIDPDRAASLFGGLGAVAGTAAPFIAAKAAGAPLFPVAAGLGLATAAGLGTDYALRKTGVTPKLEEVSRKLRSTVPQAETRNVPLNMAINYTRELFDPRSLGATALEFAPTLAASAVGGLAAAKGAGGLQAAGRKLFGPPRVPAGQESGAIMDLGVEQFSNRLATPKSAMQIGEMKEPLGAARAELGKGVEAAKSAAMSAAGAPENASRVAAQAVESALEAKGVRRGDKGQLLTKLSETPKESKKIAGYLKEVVPDIKSVADMDILARQAKNEASVLKGKGKLQGGAAYSEVANKLQKAIESLVPEKQMGELGSARRKFSTLRSFEELVLDSDENGEFSPEKFAAAWKRLSPQDKANKFDPSQIEAIDYLLKQKSPGLVSKGLDTMAKAVQIAVARSAGRGSNWGRLLSKRAPEPVRFNLPERPAVPARPTAAGGAALGGFFAQPSTPTAR